MSPAALCREKPPYKIRKFYDGWRLTRWIVWEGFEVEAFIGVFKTQPVALAVMDADALPDDYPLFQTLKEY